MRSQKYLLLVLLGLSAGAVQSEHEKGQDLKRQILNDWDTLVKKINCARVEWKGESNLSLDGKPFYLHRTDLVRFVCNQRGSLFDASAEEYNERGVGKRIYHDLQITNGDYQAELTPVSKGEGWVLKDLKMGEKHSANKVGMSGVALPWVRVPGFSISADKLLRDSHTVIVRSEAIAGAAGSPLLRVHFTSVSNVPAGGISGYLDLDPGHFHRITGYAWHVTRKSGDSDLKGTVEYESGEGIPIVKRITVESPERELKGKNKESVRVSSNDVQVFDIKYNGDVHDSEFYLSSFGIQEPVGIIAPAKPRTWLWVALAALAFALLGVLFTWLKRRAAARANTVPETGSLP